MKMEESRYWMIFTAVCVASLIGVLEYGGMINLFGAPDESSGAFDTSDDIHELGETCLDSHNGVAMHIHPMLAIVIDGENYPIPENAGIDTEICPGAMHVTHTHDESGRLHVEGPQLVDVPLEVFFDVWGKHFDSTGIFDYRDGTITMTVNGTESTAYQNLILEDEQEIVITYTSN